MKINFKSFTYSILIALFVNFSSFGQINLEEMDIQTLQQGYKTGKFTVTQVVEAYIKRIEEIDQNGPELNSVIMVNPDALTRAKELDILLKKNKKMGGMFGVPVLLKDNLDTHDKMPTTAGSRALMNSFPLKDSKVAEQLRDANAIILGKTNLSEWANFRGQKSSSGWSGLGGQTKNPYMTDCNPCGSSAGSGVAVSANSATLLSFKGNEFIKALEPAVVGILSWVSKLSFNNTGTPNISPIFLFFFNRISNSLALVSASGLTIITLLSMGPFWSIFSILFI